MPRGKQEEYVDDKGNKIKPPVNDVTTKQPEIVQVPVEVPINLELINQKLNLINQKLNLLPEIKKALETEEKAVTKGYKK